nr:MCE family protein [Saccharopolyspora sp. HNM0983]
MPQLVKFLIFAVVTVLLTGVLATTIANRTFTNDAEFSARFSDATGLNPGDEIRMAGVRIGTVDTIEVADRKVAEVRFTIDGNRPLPTTTTAAVKYRNLIGQRYIALDVGSGDVRNSLPPGSTIPLERTSPALNLTALFNGFKPLFRALDPDEVNELSHQIIQVLQGEGGTVESLLAHTASLTSTVADKDEVIGRVVTNLNGVLDTANARSPELAGLIDEMQQLVTGLAEQREPIGEATGSLADLTERTSGLLREARPPLQKDIRELDALAENFNAREPQLDRFLSGFPERIGSVTRTASYAGWFNYYSCQMRGDISIDSIGVELPIVPLPTSELPERCTR